MENQDRELLENVNVSITDVNGSQYMIQRMDGQQLISSADLLQHHNGLVVDLGSTDFIPVNYTSEDLLSQDLTEEDRNLAAALVAVQLSQQQKQQQVQQEPSQSSKVIISNQQLVLEDIDDKLIEDQEFTQEIYEPAGLHLIKSEREAEAAERNDSDDNNSVRAPSLKKSLPHKKRISKKLNNKRGGGEKTNIMSRKVLHSCNICDQVFPSFEDYNNHKSTCSTPMLANIFSCQLCNSDFATQLDFFSHLKAHYEPIVQVEEGEATEQIDEINKSSHSVIKSEEIPVSTTTIHVTTSASSPSKDNNILSSLLTMSCLECKRSFRKQKTYEAHMRDFHNKSAEQVNEFSEPEDLMADITVTNQITDDLEDDECEQAAEIEIIQDHDMEDNKTWYTGDDELQATEEDLKEMEAQEHVCHICSQPFPIRAILMQHLITCRVTNNHIPATTLPHPSEIASKKKPKKKPDLHCMECERVFSHRNSLVYHMRSHTGHRPHQCDQCGKSFFAASALKVHMRLHSGDKPYQCSECARSFRQWGDLKYHVISIHSDTKQYQCEYCGKDFARKYSLIVHRRIHTGEKNYRCEFCGKTFRASSYLQNHRRIHTGEKPHECVYCHKRFRVRSDMKRHVRTHSIKKAPGRSLTAIAHDEYPAIRTTIGASGTATTTLVKGGKYTTAGATTVVMKIETEDGSIIQQMHTQPTVVQHHHSRHHVTKIKQNDIDTESDVEDEDDGVVDEDELQQLKEENEAAVAALQYANSDDQLEIEAAVHQDGNTLYVMPILIT